MRIIDKGADTEKVFGSFPIMRALTVMAVPAIIGQLIVLFYNMADTFFIGRTANPAMVAAASLILPVFNLSVGLSNVVGIGGGTLISRLLGKGRMDEAKRVGAFSLYVSVLFSLVFSLVMLFGMKPILWALGASPESYAYARGYALCVIVLGSFPTIMSMMLSHLLRCTGHSGEAGFGISMGGILNIVLDPLFMFVLLPKGYEMIGAGLATMVSNLVSTLYFFWVFRHDKGCMLSFSFRLGLPEAASIASFFLVGIPSGLTNVLFDFYYICIDKLASGYGDVPLAAIGIVLKAERLPLNIGIGICQGMIPIIAYCYGAGKFERMRQTMQKARWCGLVIAAISILLYELFGKTMIRFFLDDAQTVEIGSRFLSFRALAAPMMFTCFHMQFFFQAIGRGPRALAIAINRMLVLNIPLLFLLNRLVGMYGIVWAPLLADSLASCFAFFLYLQYEKKVLKPKLGK